MAKGIIEHCKEGIRAPAITKTGFVPSRKLILRN
jgi:hypothetical protein